MQQVKVMKTKDNTFTKQYAQKFPIPYPVLNTMILILNAIQTILISKSNMQLNFQYHIDIGIEYNDIDFECNTNDFMFAK